MARPASALRGHILESALQLFATRGYEGTSLHDIATAVGCSKASLLYHFTSKDAILTELLTPAGEGLAALHARLAPSTGRRRRRRPSPVTSISRCVSGARSRSSSPTSPA